jgi:dephospho-CoA kinase
MMNEFSKKVYKIGVTGSIACGKSLVRNMLETYDVATIDADEIVHNILQNDKLIIEQIVDIFGKSILKDDGGINRKELAKIVFSDADKLRKLESLVHPNTYRIIKEFMTTTDSSIAAAIVPLLLENHRQHSFDAVWLVVADEALQIERLRARDNMSEEEARQRIASQMPQNIKMALADVIIENNSSVEHVETQVRTNIEKIKASMSSELI